MHRTHDQMKAELQGEAACERLRDALRMPAHLLRDVALDLAAALEVARKGLDALGAGYETGIVKAESTVRSGG